MKGPAMALPRAGLHGATGARIAATLRDAILDAEYAPAERIRQDDLAERHGASRLPVREALRMLEAEGPVTLVATTGAWASPLAAEECQEPYLDRTTPQPLRLTRTVPMVHDTTQNNKTAYR